MTIATLDDLFVHTLKTLLFAERRLARALPRMEREATDPDLKAALSTRRDLAEDHFDRLHGVFALLGTPARGERCDAVVGLIDQAEGLMARIDDTRTMDAALSTLARVIEQYEIAHRQALVALASQMGNPQAGALLRSLMAEGTVDPPHSPAPPG